MPVTRTYIIDAETSDMPSSATKQSVLDLIAVAPQAPVAGRIA
jgi:hypothetical protein